MKIAIYKLIYLYSLELKKFLMNLTIAIHTNPKSFSKINVLIIKDNNNSLVLMHLHFVMDATSNELIKLIIKIFFDSLFLMTKQVYYSVLFAINC